VNNKLPLLLKAMLESSKTPFSALQILGFVDIPKKQTLLKRA